MTQQRGQEEALYAIGIYEAYLKKYPARENNDTILGELMPFRFAWVESNDVYIDIQ